MQLLEYIEMYHEGNQAKFGRSLDPPVDRTTVNRWVRQEYTIVFRDGKPWTSAPRRPLIKE